MSLEKEAVVIVGAATAWSLDHPGAPTAGYLAPEWRCVPLEARAAVRPVLEAAVGEIGTCEQPDGSNRGPRVDVYTAPQLGIYWCAAFASWCYAHAPGGSPFGRFIASWQFYEWDEQRGRLLAAMDAPQPGDVALISRRTRAIPPRAHDARRRRARRREDSHDRRQ